MNAEVVGTATVISGLIIANAASITAHKHIYLSAMVSVWGGVFIVGGFAIMLWGWQRKPTRERGPAI